MSVADAIRAAAEQLGETSDTARLDAELLMAHALGAARSDMLLRHMRDPAPDTFAALVERRAKHEPVAYITGFQEFYGRAFHVTPDTLIPRGDSETLIEAALEQAPGASRVLDLGTGTGALLLTFLAETQALGVGIDRSPAAIEIATKNVQRLGMTDRAELRAADWTTAGWAEPFGQFDLILCNPPYVEENAELEPDVHDFEPASALFAGPKGLDDYRILFPQLGKLLSPEGVAIFEIGASQGIQVSEIANKSGFSAQLRHDLAGRPRALICTSARAQGSPKIGMINDRGLAKPFRLDRP
ncbi:peptide chain release factor N(5)-glutamine methyltransferase [Qipengyuania sp. DGS5-3]|uniref:peptide chain release factor N(5)-glutamine methyltransferase n=1 Tax=Qipengyuania sp. DGS5-3 TaxID=3349632 RepID=UPI0036D2F92F